MNDTSLQMYQLSSLIEVINSLNDVASTTTMSVRDNIINHTDKLTWTIDFDHCLLVDLNNSINTTWIAGTSETFNPVETDFFTNVDLLDFNQNKHIYIDDDLFYLGYKYIGKFEGQNILIVFLQSRIKFSEQALIIIELYGSAIRSLLEAKDNRTKQLALEYEKIELERVSELKSTFLSNMSHEIRTPMNGIYGTLQLLRSSTESKNNLRLVESAILSTECLLRVINDILDFSIIESDSLVIEKVEFNIHNLVDSVKSDFSNETLESNINFSCHIDDNVPVIWLGDTLRIKQIISNILSNAFKFTEQGKIELHISCNSIGSAKEQELSIQVSDTGIGMSRDTVKNLFERFEQGDNSKSRKFGGTGLGMPISASLVELMNGAIHIDSEVGRGTDISVMIPLETIDTAMAKILPEVDDLDLSNKTVMIVEDDMVNRMILKKMLKQTKATIIEAIDGKEAISQYENLTPDLILMDIQMPNMDGMEACQIIRESGYSKPIIACTANVMKQEVESYLNSGFDDCVSKPIEMSTLHGSIFKLLSE